MKVVVEYPEVGSGGNFNSFSTASLTSTPDSKDDFMKAAVDFQNSAEGLMTSTMEIEQRDSNSPKHKSTHEANESFS